MRLGGVEFGRFQLAILATIYIVLLLVLHGCAASTPERRAAVQFAVQPKEERAIVLSDDIDETLSALRAAKAVIVAHWDDFHPNAQRVFKDVAAHRGQSIIAKAQEIGDAGGEVSAFKIQITITQALTAYKKIKNIIDQKRAMFTDEENAILNEADDRLIALYETAKKARTAAEIKETSDAVKSVARVLITTAL